MLIHEIPTTAKTLLVFMRERKTRGWLLVILFSSLVGCAAKPSQAWFLQRHRENYTLNKQELQNLQFFISTNVLAQYEDATGRKSVLVTKGTPGVVTDVGPNWLKVSFRKGGADIPFVTTQESKGGRPGLTTEKKGSTMIIRVTESPGEDTRYWFATEVEGKEGFHEIRKLPEKVFLHEGTRYQLIYGANAFLLVDTEELYNVIKTRKPTEGRRVGDR